MSNFKFYSVIVTAAGFFVLSLFNLWGASLEWHFILSLIATYHLTAVSKAVRDIIQYRFSWSIMDECHTGLKKYLLDIFEKEIEADREGFDYPDTLDGWHQADGIILMAPIALVVYWGNYFIFNLAWYWLLPLYLVIVFGFFYQNFRFFYHYFFMQKERRDWGLFRKERKLEKVEVNN